jgi:uncharacterized membrane protein
VGNVAAIEESWPPRDLRIAGTQLHYYVGDYVQAAASARVMHLDPATILLRLDPRCFFL